MPIYQLVCPKCGQEKEVICKFEDTQNIECPECKTLMIRKPVGSAFRVEGYSFANGYHRETIDYAGRTVG